jgi:hypothetical protein
MSTGAVEAKRDTQGAQSLSVTGNLEFAAGTTAKRSTNKAKESGGAQVLYKLLDFGTAVGIHEDETVTEHDTLMTFTELEFAG